jgi:hypothetical protein
MAKVLVPGGRVRDRIITPVLEDDGVAPVPLDPLDRRLRGIALRADPVAEDGRESALVQMGSHVFHDLLADRVSAETAVAIDEARVRGDDVWRVGHHEVEPAPRKRLEPAAHARLEVRDAVEPRIQLGERGCPGIDVRRHHLGAVRGGGQSLDTAARPEIEDRIDVAADGQVRESCRCGSQPHDVVRALSHVCSVAGEQHVVPGMELNRGAGLAAGQLDQTRPDEVLDALRIEQPPQALLFDGPSEEEQRGEIRERAVRAKPAGVDGRIERREPEARSALQRFAQSGGRVAGVHQGFPQPAQRARILGDPWAG